MTRPMRLRRGYDHLDLREGRGKFWGPALKQLLAEDADKLFLLRLQALHAFFLLLTDPIIYSRLVCRGDRHASCGRRRGCASVFCYLLNMIRIYDSPCTA